MTATGANLLEPQKIANAPIVNDTEFSSFELQGGTDSSHDTYGRSFAGDERRGPNGTVWIANDLRQIAAEPNFTMPLLELQQRTYVHELGNLLSRKISPDGSARTFGDPNNNSDTDTGYQLEECVFGDVRP